MKDTQVYEPFRDLKLGIKIWARMFGELHDYRELVWRLVSREFSAKYKQSLLGNCWNVLMPLAAIGTFMYLNHAGILHINKVPIPYPLYALIGLTVWQIFANGINSGANSLVGSGDLITKINFPREILVLASLGPGLLDFLVKFALIIVFFIVFRFVPSWKIIFLPLVLLPIISLTIGFSLVLALLNGVARDTANIVSLLVMFLMFLTPVLYPIDATGHLLFKLNFISPLVNAPRDLIAFGCIKQPAYFVFASVISFLILFLSWRIFHLAETKIPERI